MATAPTSEAMRQLYSSLLRTSRTFSSYNFRTYFVRRTKESFEAVKNETDPQKLSAFYAEQSRELAVLKRSAIVNQLYGGWKLAVEEPGPELRSRVDK